MCVCSCPAVLLRPSGGGRQGRSTPKTLPGATRQGLHGHLQDLAQRGLLLTLVAVVGCTVVVEVVILLESRRDIGNSVSSDRQITFFQGCIEWGLLLMVVVAVGGAGMVELSLARAGSDVRQQLMNIFVDTLVEAPVYIPRGQTLYNHPADTPVDTRAVLMAVGV